MKDINVELAISESQISIALKTAVNILDKWGISDAEKHAIFAIEKPNSNDNTNILAESQLLSEGRKTRISYILNIHENLRTLFSNSENVYGFIKLKNNNPPFNGLSPLEYILQNPENALAEVDRHLSSLILN